MVKRIVQQFLLVALLASIYFNYVQYRTLEGKDLELIESKNRLEHSNDKNEYLKKDQQITSLFNNAIKLETEFESISSSGTMRLKDLVKDRTLVFAFSHFDCDDCTVKQLGLLTKIKTEHKQLKVMILMAYSNTRNFKNYAKMSNGEVPVFGTSAKLPFGKQCYFVLEKDGSAHNFFIPDALDEESTIGYLNGIVGRLTGN